MILIPFIRITITYSIGQDSNMGRMTLHLYLQSHVAPCLEEPGVWQLASPQDLAFNVAQLTRNTWGGSGSVDRAKLFEDFDFPPLDPPLSLPDILFFFKVSRAAKALVLFITSEPSSLLLLPPPAISISRALKVAEFSKIPTRKMSYRSPKRQY